MKIEGKLITVKMSQVEPNDWNFNQMSPALLAKEKESIARFGVVKVPLVWEPRPGRYVIIDGEHRYTVLKEEGEEKITVRNLGKIKEKEAKQLTILLNEIRGEPDYAKLSTLFGSLSEVTAEDISKFLPWSTAEVSAMIDSADFDWTEYDFSRPDGSGDTSRKPTGEYVEIICRVREDEAGMIEEKAETLCGKHGFHHKSTPVQLGMLFEHMLNNAQKERR